MRWTFHFYNAEHLRELLGSSLLLMVCVFKPPLNHWKRRSLHKSHESIPIQSCIRNHPICSPFSSVESLFEIRWHAIESPTFRVESCWNPPFFMALSDNKVLHGTSKSSGSPLFFHSMTISWVYGIRYTSFSDTPSIDWSVDPVSNVVSFSYWCL